MTVHLLNSVMMPRLDREYHGLCQDGVYQVEPLTRDTLFPHGPYGDLLYQVEPLTQDQFAEAVIAAADGDELKSWVGYPKAAELKSWVDSPKATRSVDEFVSRLTGKSIRVNPVDCKPRTREPLWKPGDTLLIIESKFYPMANIVGMAVEEGDSIFKYARALFSVPLAESVAWLHEVTSQYRWDTSEFAGFPEFSDFFRIENAASILNMLSKFSNFPNDTMRRYVIRTHQHAILTHRDSINTAAKRTVAEALSKLCKSRLFGEFIPRWTYWQYVDAATQLDISEERLRSLLFLVDFEDHGLYGLSNYAVIWEKEGFRISQSLRWMRRLLS